MAKKTNKLLLIGGVLAAFLLFSNRGNANNDTNQNEPYYNVPGVGAVPHSQMPNYGYVMVQGQWIHQSQLQGGGSGGGGFWDNAGGILDSTGNFITNMWGDGGVFNRN